MCPSYDAVGNLTGDNDFVNLQRQCFGYDQRNRLTTAYTAYSFNACGTPDGTWPAPYNQTYSYDTSNRIINGPAGTNYQYAAVGHAHAPSLITTPGGVDTYTYDTTGNRTTWNNADGGDYTYTWDPNGRMKTATSNDPNTNPERRTVDTTVTATTGTVITAATPTSTRTGDVLVAVVTIAPATVGGAIPTATTPTGWTKINESVGTGVRVVAYQKALTTTVPANITVTRSAASKTILNLAAYTGVDLTTPVDTSAVGTNPSGTSHTSPSLAVTGANRKLLTITGYAQQTSTAPATGMTERVDNSTLPTAPTTSLHIADQTWASTAATGTRIATSAVASTSATISVALRPRANTTDYLYDINRHQILRKDPTNTVTLTIGNLELQQRAVSTPWATRYINIENTNIGIRNPAVNEWILDDERGSVQTTIDYTTGTTHQNFYTPYGQTRYAYPTNPVTPHSYLNQTNEPATQLTNLNNRYYDPTVGVFISVDPLVTQTGTAYLYGNANPTTYSDPSGLDPCGRGMNHSPCPGGPAAPGSSGSSPVPGYHPDHRPAACTDPLCSGTNPNDDQTSVCSSADRCYRDGSSGGTSQAAFCGWPSRWSMCSDISYDYRDQAYAKVAELAKVYGWDRGQTNAFRHSYFMGLIAWNYGSSTATEFGQRHERDTPKQTLFVAWDSAADLWNNSIGIAVVERVKGATDISAPGASVPAYGMNDVTQQLTEMVTCRCAGNSNSRFNLATVTVVRGVFVPGPFFDLDTDVPSG